MPAAIRGTIQVLEIIVQELPIGTNLGLLHMMWAMVSGAFLSSRGAIFPALQKRGFDKERIRRGWSALRYGSWKIEELIEVWRRHVMREGKWQVRHYEGYRPLAVDWTAFWRPQLRGWRGRFFHRLANRALRGVGYGVIVEVGDLDGHRLPLLRRIIRIEGEDMSDNRLKKETLRWVSKKLAEDEIAILDAGVQVSECQEAGLKRFVVRLAINRIGRRNVLAKHKKQGRPPEYGKRITSVASQSQGRGGDNRCRQTRYAIQL